MIERQSLVQRVKALAEALEGSEVGELDLTEHGLRIAIRRQLEPEPQYVTQVAEQHASSRGRRHRVASGPMRRETTGRGAFAGAPAENPGVAIAAPLTGVYYNAPSPSSPPFIAVGDTVQAGQVVCIVEAMKVFNEIKAEISGVVVATIATNGQLVQKGDPLIRVNPI